MRQPIKEIEQKFLLWNTAEEIIAEHYERKLTIDSSYISENPEIRVNSIISGNGDPKICMKTGSGLVRDETEIPLTMDLHDLLLNACKKKPVRKTRYYFPILLNDSNDFYHSWEVDVYEGDLKGIITAEIEYMNEKEYENTDLGEIHLPWMKIYKDVTDEYMFKNCALYNHPYMALNSVIFNNVKMAQGQ